MPENYYSRLGYYSITYGTLYYDGYGYNFYYKTYGYYEYSDHPDEVGAIGWGWYLFLAFVCCLHKDKEEEAAAAEDAHVDPVIDSSDEEDENEEVALNSNQMGVEGDESNDFLVEDDYLWSHKPFRLPLKIEFSVTF